MTKYQNIIQNFHKQKILVVGDFMLDEYVHGQVERISPEAPVPVVLQEKTRIFPGGAGNVVCNLHALGAQVYLVGVVGKDEGATYLSDTFAKLGLRKEQIGLVPIENRPTTRKTRIMAAKQQICRLDQEVHSPLSYTELGEVRTYIQKNIKEMSAIIFSDYDKGLIIPELIAETVALGKDCGCLIAVDPQVTHFDYYRDVDLLTPNHHEAGRYLGRKLVEQETIHGAGPVILERLQARLLLLTRGEKGMTLFERDNDQIRDFPTQAQEVFDVTGAGDTVISIFTLALAAEASLEQAVHLSNAGAGIVVGHIGAATVSPEELALAVQSS